MHVNNRHSQCAHARYLRPAVLAGRRAGDVILTDILLTAVMDNILLTLTLVPLVVQQHVYYHISELITIYR